MQTLPRHKATIRTSQEHKTSRYLAGLPRPTHRARELLLGFLAHGFWDERRPHRTGTYGVDADAALDLLVGERAREGYDGAFGGCVVEEVGMAYWVRELGGERGGRVRKQDSP